MGLVYAEVELINGADMANASSNFIEKDSIRKMKVNMLVDSGAYMLAINENIQQQLQLPVVEKRIFELAGGQSVEYDVVSQVELRFKNRRCLVDAVMLPGDSEPLLGAIPMENMDVLIDPKQQELIVNPAHPYKVKMKLK